MELAVLKGGPLDGQQRVHSITTDMVVKMDDLKYAWYRRTDRTGTASGPAGPIRAREFVFDHYCTDDDLEVMPEEMSLSE